MKITVSIEFDLATCFNSEGNFPPDFKDWEYTDIRFQALFDDKGYFREESFDALSDAISKNKWSWMCDAVALWHMSANPLINCEKFFLERK